MASTNDETIQKKILIKIQENFNEIYNFSMVRTSSLASAFSYILCRGVRYEEFLEKAQRKDR